MIPKGTRGVVCRNVDFVLEFLTWRDFEEDVVAVSGWRYVQSMKVQVGCIEAARYRVISSVRWRTGRYTLPSVGYYAERCVRSEMDRLR